MDGRCRGILTWRDVGCADPEKLMRQGNVELARLVLQRFLADRCFHTLAEWHLEDVFGPKLP